jgi:hypothetical protein
MEDHDSKLLDLNLAVEARLSFHIADESYLRFVAVLLLFS